MCSIHIPPGEGQSYPMIDGDHVAKAAVHDTNGGLRGLRGDLAGRADGATTRLAVDRSAVPARGQVTALVGDTKYEVEPGRVVMFPAGTPSSFEVVGESARFVAITSGDRAGRFFADFSSSVPSDQPVEESMEAIRSVIQRLGVRLAGA